MTLVPLDPATLRPLPITPALSGVLETLAFFRDPDFARSRFERYGDVYETSLLGPLSSVNRNGADHAMGPIRRIWRSSGRSGI